MLIIMRVSALQSGNSAALYAVIALVAIALGLVVLVLIRTGMRCSPKSAGGPKIPPAALLSHHGPSIPPNERSRR